MPAPRDEYAPTMLTALRVPAAVPEQLGRFTMESIRAQSEDEFRLAPSRRRQVVLAIDIGGDSITTAVTTYRHGKLRSATIDDRRGVKEGEGYLGVLEDAATFARDNYLPVGISFAGPMDGTRPAGGENVGVFLKELRGQRYKGDFKGLFGEQLAAAENDAVAGLKASVNHIKNLGHTGVKNIIYAINGSGLNTSVYRDGEVWSTESGHVEIVNSLNPRGQDTACGKFGAYVCVERVAAGKAGIEALWAKHWPTTPLSGREIEQEWRKGSKLAGELYAHSALVMALTIQGVANAFELDVKNNATVVVGHGGTFKFPEYGLRVQQIMAHHQEAATPIFMTHEFSANACLDGAALAALSNAKQPNVPGT